MPEIDIEKLIKAVNSAAAAASEVAGEVVSVATDTVEGLTKIAVDKAGKWIGSMKEPKEPQSEKSIYVIQKLNSGDQITVYSDFSAELCYGDGTPISDKFRKLRIMADKDFNELKAKAIEDAHRFARRLYDDYRILSDRILLPHKNAPKVANREKMKRKYDDLSVYLLSREYIGEFESDEDILFRLTEDAGRKTMNAISIGQGTRVNYPHLTP